MTVGEYIREQRRAQKISQRELATMIGTSDAEICRIETSIRKQPSPTVLKKISCALDLSINHLYELANYLDSNAISPDISNSKKDFSDQYIFIGDLSKEEAKNVADYIQFLKQHRNLN